MNLPEDVAAEYRTARSTAAVFRWRSAGVIHASGSEAAEFLQNMVSNDVEALQPGEGCMSTFLTNKGKIVGDFVLLAGEGEFDLITFFAPTGPLLEGLNQLLVSEDVALADRSGQFVLLSVQGPLSSDLIREWGVERSVFLPDLGPSASSHGRFRHREIIAAARPARILLLDHFGDGGFDVLVRPEDADVVEQALSSKLPGCIPPGEETLEILRVESGWPRFGVDMGPENLLVETGLQDIAVSFEKGCYVGQEFVARMTYRGQAAKRLRGITLQGREIPSRGESVWVAGLEKPIGEVRSAVYSPALARPIALAYLTTRQDELKQVLIRRGSQILEGELAALPFYRKG